MKKTLYSFVAFAAIAMTVASCSSDVDNNNTPATGEKVAKTFSATQEISGVSSRTALDTTDPTKVNWLSTDAITVWDGTAKNQFTVTPKSDATTADISGSVTAGSTSFTAVYPNSVGQNCTYTDGSIAGLVIPATQTATAGSFDPAAAAMVATTTGTNLAFKNVCAFLKIKAAADYTKIVVSTTSADIAGTFSVANFATAPTLTATTGVKEITLSGTIEATKDYYIAIAPCSNVADLTIKCYTSATEYVERTSSKTPTFERAGVYYMGETTETNGWKAPQDPNLLGSYYTVSAGEDNTYGTTDDKRVKFTRSNIYWDGSAYHFEENPTDYKTSYVANHVSHFYWTSWNENNKPYASSYNMNNQSNTDVFWCNEDHKITVDGTSGLFVLSQEEWDYLVSGSRVNNGQALLKYGVTVTNGSMSYENCLIIAPDDYDYSPTGNGQLKDSYTLEEINSLGLVCLPAAGYRSTGSYTDAGKTGIYWSSTLGSNNVGLASAFNLSYKRTNPASRFCRCSIRLVQNAQN